MNISIEDVIIKEAAESEYEDAMGLAWKTFLRFEADDYTEEGVNSFRDFITDQTLKTLFLKGKYLILLAFYKREMIGVVSLRNNTHISLLFVDEKYHMNGVGRKLMQSMCTYLKEKKEFRITVHSSPYAVNFYHKLGFVDLQPEQAKDGIRYTPMLLVL